MYYAFPDGHSAANREDADRDDQRPEVNLLAVSKWVVRIGGTLAFSHPHQQQHFIAAIDDRVDCFREHRRAARDSRSNKLTHGNSDVAEEGCVNDLFRT